MAVVSNSASLPDNVVTGCTKGGPTAGSEALGFLGHPAGYRREGDGGSDGTRDRWCLARVGDIGWGRGCRLGQRLHFDIGGGGGGLAGLKLLGECVISDPGGPIGIRRCGGHRGCH